MERIGPSVGCSTVRKNPVAARCGSATISSMLFMRCTGMSARSSASIQKAVEPWFPAEPATLIDEHEIRSAGWIYHVPEADMPTDWPEAIFLAKRGCPVSFTFETPSANCLHDRTAAHVAAVKAALAFR